MSEDGSETGNSLQRVEAIFHAVLAVPAAQRAAVLDKRCENDAELLAEVSALLDASAAEEALGRRMVGEVRSAADTAARGRLIGPYRLERLLGRGGMGAVYLAARADGQFEQRVAIKIVDLPLATDGFRERFRLERQILAGLSHPYIARLLDGGVSDAGDLYLVMEYIDGLSITRYCAERNLSLRDRLLLFDKVCEAVQFAHQSLVVHRDLKPDNIFVAADGTPRLLDFGTAKLLVPIATDADLTQHGLHPFTPLYASPEQVLGEAISTATDTYALGVLLYLLLTGVPPYTLTEFTTSEMLRVICSEQPPRPSTATPVPGAPRVVIDADLDAVILKALRKEPQHRYQTVAQFAADLRAWLAGMPVQARRGTLRYRAHKFIRRNKLPLAATALVAGSVIAGIVGVLWQSRVANVERGRAEARSEDLRQLSRSLLSEVAEAIKNLPGSTSVQHMLVQRVMDHLDRMSKDADGDAATLADLVDAYTRLGDIQGNPYDQNIGDAPGGLVSLDKAVAIATALRASAPHDDRSLAALALAQQSRSEVLFGIGRTEEAIATMRLALEVFTTRAASPNASAAVLADAASAAGSLGDQLGQSGTSSRGDSTGALLAFNQALGFQHRALALDPTYLRSLRGVAIDHLKIGNLLLDIDPAKSISAFRESLVAWSVLPALEREAIPVKRGIAQTRMKLGLAYNEIRDYDAALAAFDETQTVYDEMLAADKTDARAQYDAAVFYSNRSFTHVDMADADLNPSPEKVRLAHARLAVSDMQVAAGLLQRLIDVNATNTVWTTNLAYEKVIIGSMGSLYGADGAAATAASGLATLRKASEDPAAPVNVLDMATSAMIRILPVRLRDPASAEKLAERLVSLTHRQKPSYLLLLAQSARQNHSPARSAAIAHEALTALPATLDPAHEARLSLQLKAQLDPG